MIRYKEYVDYKKTPIQYAIMPKLKNPLSKITTNTIFCLQKAI